MVRTTVRTQSARRDDTYEETVTDTERRSRRTTSVSFSEERLYIEHDWQGETPDSSEIVPDAGPMPPVSALPAIAIPRLGGDSTAEPDA